MFRMLNFDLLRIDVCVWACIRTTSSLTLSEQHVMELKRVIFMSMLQTRTIGDYSPASAMINCDMDIFIR